MEISQFVLNTNIILLVSELQQLVPMMPIKLFNQLMEENNFDLAKPFQDEHFSGFVKEFFGKLIQFGPP